jgi:hypothetical protein
MPPDHLIETPRIEGLFSHPAVGFLHGTKVVVWVGVERKKEGIMNTLLTLTATTVLLSSLLLLRRIW